MDEYKDIIAQKSVKNTSNHVVELSKNAHDIIQKTADQSRFKIPAEDILDESLNDTFYDTAQNELNITGSQKPKSSSPAKTLGFSGQNLNTNPTILTVESGLSSLNSPIKSPNHGSFNIFSPTGQHQNQQIYSPIPGYYPQMIQPQNFV